MNSSICDSTRPVRDEAMEADPRIERRAKEALKELDAVKSALVLMIGNELGACQGNEDENDSVESTVLNAHDAFSALRRARELIECMPWPSSFELEDAEAEEAEGEVQQ